MGIELSESTYKPYNLRGNPFHPAGLPIQDDPIWAGRHKLRRHIELIIKRVLRSRKSECIVINGDYGTGKSHTLLFFHKNINEARYDGSSISIYIKNPGRTITDFYLSLINSLSHSLIVQVSKKVAGAAIREFLSDLAKPGDAENAQYLLERCKDLLSHENLTKALVQKRVASRDFASSIAWLALDENTEIVWKWLSGVRLEPRQMRRIGALTQLYLPEQVEEALCGLVGMLRACGYSTVFLMLDEVEDLLNVRDDKLRFQYLCSLRRIIDRNPMNFCFIFACTEDGWREILLNYQPLASRLAKGNFIQLFNLTFEEMRVFIEEYLRQYRTADPLFPLYPFKDEALKCIHELSNGCPREIVKLCALAIERSIDKGEKAIQDITVRESIS